MSTYDVRQPDEYQCDQSASPAFRRPAMGVEHLARAWNPYKPSPGGEQVFNLTMIPSFDCSKFVPEGYFAMNTKKGHLETMQDMSSSSAQLVKRSNNAVSFGISASVQASDFGVSHSTEMEFQQGISHKNSKTYISTSLHSIEDTYIMSSVFPPRFSDDFHTMIDTHIDSSFDELEGHNEAAEELTKKYPFFVKKAVTGESYGQVRDNLC